MTVGGKELHFDWTVNITSVVNLIMLLGLCITAIGSYYELKNNVKVALDYASEAKGTISSLEAKNEAAVQSQSEIRIQLGVIGTKLDNLQANFEKIDKRLPN